MGPFKDLMASWYRAWFTFCLAYLISSLPLLAQEERAPSTDRASSSIIPSMVDDVPSVQSDHWAEWLDLKGQEYWGVAPDACDDLLLARRLYLDLLGRVPSVSEVRDYLDLPTASRRKTLIHQLVFHEGSRSQDNARGFAEHWARQWRHTMVPQGMQGFAGTGELEAYLAKQFHDRVPFDRMMFPLIEMKDTARDGSYFRLSQSNPATYAANVSRVMLGVRMECAQCHDHPFTDWKQEDFWGLAAFYSDLGPMAAGGTVSVRAGEIENEGKKYVAKYLWSESGKGKADPSRVRFASWVTSSSNRQFASVAANRLWQQLVGRGVFRAVDDLDTASSEQRQLLDELASKFASAKFPTQTLIAAICKSRWYQAVSNDVPDAASSQANNEVRIEQVDEVAKRARQPFARPTKTLTPEQVFDSLEQALMLPISRLDPGSARWTGDRMQLISRLSESAGKTPEEYAAGVPQALMMMNGKMTSDAIGLENSRLLRATLESPFMSQKDRLETLCLATLSRNLTQGELSHFTEYINNKPNDEAKKRAHGEILWALVNSPEFVLCR